MKRILSYILIVSVFFASCQKETSLETGIGVESFTLNLHFDHLVNGIPLTLNSNLYVNSFGEDYTVTKLRYYVTNIQLRQTGTSHFLSVPNSYFLVDEALDSSKSIKLLLSSGKFDMVSFLLGVDSLRNVSGAQSGALDPTRDMFWTWNSGYIQFKLEGTSSFSTLPDSRIEYHIGGFHTPYNTIRRIDLPLSTTGLINIRSNNSSDVTIGVDVDKWFNGTHDLDIASFPTCTAPGMLASQFADNYETLFFVSNVVNN